MKLSELGWNACWEERFRKSAEPGWQPGRVLRQDRGQYAVACENQTFSAVCSGRFMHQAVEPTDFPAVGDWVAIEPPKTGELARIHVLLPRKTEFVRKMAGKAQRTQVVAANVDTVLLVTGLDQNFNLRRIERYLALARVSRARPVIVLNKLDACDDPAGALEATEEIAGGAPIVMVSATRGEGVPALSALLAPSETAALLGSSGVGKSTLLNALIGENVQEVREHRATDARGRHTTTARELFPLPSGALLIDTPGMRELGMIDDAVPSEDAFADLDALAAQCRFSDCRHHGEPGCAVRAAVEGESVDPRRVESWLKLRAEQVIAARRRAERMKREASGRWKRARHPRSPHSGKHPDQD